MIVRFAAIVFAAVTLLAYPAAPRSAASSTYFGTRVGDPYRELENLHAPDTQRWASAQNSVARTYLDSLNLRDTLAGRLRLLWRYRSARESFRYGTQTFEHRRIGGVAVLLSTRAGARSRVLLAAKERIAGSAVALETAIPSPDGSAILFATTGRRSSWYLRSVATLRTRPIALTSADVSTITWDRRGTGIFYSSKKRNDRFPSLIVRYCRLRAPRTDHVIFRVREPAGSTVDVKATRDGRWAVFTIQPWGVDRSRVFVYPVSGGRARELFANEWGNHTPIDSIGAGIAFTTSWHCPDGCVVRIAPEKGMASLRTVIPDNGKAIEAAASVGSNLFVSYIRNSSSSIDEFDANGHHRRRLKLPATGTISATDFRDDGTGKALIASFTNYVCGPTILRFDASDGSRTVLGTTFTAYDRTAFVTEERAFASIDGTRVHLFVSHRRGIQLDGRNPTILYVYGGFGVPQEPVWTPEIVSWLSLGGVFAVVNARGGDENGEAWHQAATVLNKQRTIDDTIGAAIALDEQGYADARHLAVRGDSNGGFMAGAAISERPDLFAALITREGLLDVLRAENIAHAAYWRAEYGSPTASPAQFRNLLRLSPVETIRPGIRYPAALVQTGDADDVVSPSHSYKFVATLQADQASTEPILLRIDHGVGHYGGESLAGVIAESVDQYAFLLETMNVRSVGSFGLGSKAAR